MKRLANKFKWKYFGNYWKCYIWKNGEEKEITIYEIVLDLDNFDTLIHCGIRSLENEGTSIDKWFNSKEFFNEIKN